MTTTKQGFGGPVLWTLGAIAWLAGPLALQASNVFERTRPWEGLPLTAYLVGSLFIVLGGLALLLAIMKSDRGSFGARSWVGVALVVLGLVVSGIATWAIPIWAGLYGVGLLVLASSGVVRQMGYFLGATFLAAPATLILLTELEVGSRDSYGDYPLAWTAAYWIAGIGAAFGLARWSRSGTRSHSDVLMANHG